MRSRVTGSLSCRERRGQYDRAETEWEISTPALTSYMSNTFHWPLASHLKKLLANLLVVRQLTTPLKVFDVKIKSFNWQPLSFVVFLFSNRLSWKPPQDIIHLLRLCFIQAPFVRRYCHYITTPNIMLRPHLAASLGHYDTPITPLSIFWCQVNTINIKHLNLREHWTIYLTFLA